MVTEFKRMQQRRDTTANWASENPILLAGELGYDTDTDVVKIGDGVLPWLDLLPVALNDASLAGLLEGPSVSRDTLNAVFGPLTFLGSWDASTNDPALSDGAGTTSTFYEVSAAGVVNLGSGDITFNAGDFVSYDGEVWTRTANTTPTNVIETAENDLRLVRGTIDTSGSGTIVEGGGFSITRNNVGDVTVTFADAFSGVPSVTLAPLGGGSALGPIASHKNGFTRTPAAFRVEVVSIGAGFADGVFDFIAVGPQ